MIGAAFVMLVKDPYHQGKGQLFYYDIGDYKDRKQKLQEISEYKRYAYIPCKPILHDRHHLCLN